MSRQGQNKKIGTAGEDFVLKRFINKGFLLYKRNIRQWGHELDLVVYRYVPQIRFLEIRIVEVKTRTTWTSSCGPDDDFDNDMESYGLKNKWLRARKVMFTFKDEISGEVLKIGDVKISGSKTHFDLAVIVVSVDGTFRVNTYIKDVNLFI